MKFRLMDFGQRRAVKKRWLPYLSCIVTLLCWFVLPSCGAAQKLTTYPWNWHVCHAINAPELKNAALSREEKASILRAESAAFLNDEKWRASRIDANFSLQEFDKKWRTSPEGQKELATILDEERIRKIDLNGDGSPEFLIMGGALQASGDGNRPFRILGKRDGQYQVLLDAVGQCITVDRRQNQKQAVVLLYTHFSVSRGHLPLVQFSQGASKNIDEIRNIANFLVEWPGKGAFHGPPQLIWTRERETRFDALVLPTE